jgi:hypothetical protein
MTQITPSTTPSNVPKVTFANPAARKPILCHQATAAVPYRTLVESALESSSARKDLQNPFLAQSAVTKIVTRRHHAYSARMETTAKTEFHDLVRKATIVTTIAQQNHSYQLRVILERSTIFSDRFRIHVNHVLLDITVLNMVSVPEQSSNALQDLSVPAVQKKRGQKILSMILESLVQLELIQRKEHLNVETVKKVVSAIELGLQTQKWTQMNAQLAIIVILDQHLQRQKI